MHSNRLQRRPAVRPAHIAPANRHLRSLRANRTALCVVLAAAGLVIAGLVRSASAGQNSQIKPVVPGASDLRPLPPFTAGAADKSRTDAAPAGKSLAGSQGGASPALDYMDILRPRVDEKTGITTGNDFTYRRDDMTMTGSRVRWDKNKRLLDAEGNLVLDDDKHHMTGDKAHVDDRKSVKLAIFTGNVVIVIKPKADTKAANRESAPANGDVAKEKDRGAIITCDKVEDYYKKEFAILTGRLNFTQKLTKADGHVVERTGTASHAEYDGKAHKLHLFPPVDGKDSDGQVFHAEHDVILGTKEGEETMQSDGPIHVVLLRDDEKDSEKDGDKGSEKDADKGGAKDSGKQDSGKQDDKAGNANSKPGGGRNR